MSELFLKLLLDLSDLLPLDPLHLELELGSLLLLLIMSFLLSLSIDLLFVLFEINDASLKVFFTLSVNSAELIEFLFMHLLDQGHPIFILLLLISDLRLSKGLSLGFLQLLL